MKTPKLPINKEQGNGNDEKYAAFLSWPARIEICIAGKVD